MFFKVKHVNIAWLDLLHSENKRVVSDCPGICLQSFIEFVASCWLPNYEYTIKNGKYLTKNYHNSRNRDEKLPLYDSVRKTTTFFLIRGKKLPSREIARFASSKRISDRMSPPVSINLLPPPPPPLSGISSNTLRALR